MKPLEQIRFERLERMLDWRVGQAPPTNNHLAEAEALSWAMTVILGCFNGDTPEVV